MIGRTISHYQIVEKIGEGGMGVVYKARDTQLRREVALKVLPVRVATDPDRKQRFEQEAQAAGALNHPNVVSIHDFGTENGIPFIVTELVEGESLRALIGRGPLPIRKAIDIAVQMADGLAAAHAAGITHRDLKPENVMVTFTGRIKILDFGLAKHTALAVGTSAETISMGHTQPGVVVGTVGYMSPEQVRGKPVDHRSDIFSFGTVLYEMLTARSAFERESAVETMNAILNNDPPEFDETGGAVPFALQCIVRHCLEKGPDERFQSAWDLAFALEAIAKHPSLGAVPAVFHCFLRSQVCSTCGRRLAVFGHRVTTHVPRISTQLPRGASAGRQTRLRPPHRRARSRAFS